MGERKVTTVKKKIVDEVHAHKIALLLMYQRCVVMMQGIKFSESNSLTFHVFWYRNSLKLNGY